MSEKAVKEQKASSDGASISDDNEVVLEEEWVEGDESTVEEESMRGEVSMEKEEAMEKEEGSVEENLESAMKDSSNIGYGYPFLFIHPAKPRAEYEVEELSKLKKRIFKTRLFFANSAIGPDSVFVRTRFTISFSFSSKQLLQPRTILPPEYL
mmetsp:Transcript_19406/g.47932  ORF Transcript_19406/g.47932 Transcript_19406/m.47932 type:complete len:153 (+) Transcript_19406:225-683(+)